MDEFWTHLGGVPTGPIGVSQVPPTVCRYLPHSLLRTQGTPFHPRVPDTELTKCIWHSFKAKANTTLPSWSSLISKLLPVCVCIHMYICFIYIMMLLEVYCIYSCSNLHCVTGALVLGFLSVAHVPVQNISTHSCGYQVFILQLCSPIYV